MLCDYLKAPIDRLYFQKPIRPFLGIRNTLIDILAFGSNFYIEDFPGLWVIEPNFRKILYEFKHVDAPKYYFHDLSPWFEHNEHYYYYKVKDFPFLNALIHSIPCIDKETGMFAVIDGPMKIPPHRAESNAQLRYHLTLEGDDSCVLYTDKGAHTHTTGEEFIFDHSRYHELEKTGDRKRIVLILDIHRFTSYMPHSNSQQPCVPFHASPRKGDHTYEEPQYPQSK
jgi:hypothetical protein